MAMQSLEPEQRAILTLRDVRGLDYRDIAESMNLAIGTVKSRLFRSRQALREAMEALMEASDSLADEDQT
jgi:RNA polymerase sigma-70 factor (ECF subfamily)